MVKTRGALEREKLKHTTTEPDTDQNMDEVHSHKSCIARIMKEELKPSNLNHTYQQPTEKEGSREKEPGAHTAKSSNTMSNASSLIARRKQLELEAAEAKAKIEKELIDKKLAADLAALDEQLSRKSRSSGRSSVTRASQKVEQWLEKSHQNIQEDPGAPSDLRQLAQAMEKMATSTQTANTRLLSRLATSKDLPIFSGDVLEWIQFKKSYTQSTMLCNYSDSENIARLEKCLRGEARETVSSLLTSDSSPSIILEALELRFGRPDLIIHKITTQIKKLLPLPQAYHTELVNFAVKIKNYVAAAESIKQTDHLRSPELLTIVISKCPSPLINKWADYIYEHCDPSKAKLQLFSEFLHKEATKIAAAGITHIHSQTEHKFPKKLDYERKVPVYSVLNNNNDCNARCKFCKTSTHTLSSCTKFKRALRRDKWRFVKINNLCHKCLLPGHGKETCPAAPCDVDGCGLPHHRLLHWPTKPNQAPRNTSPNEDLNNTSQDSQVPTTSESEVQSPATETVTNTIVEPSTSVMLKIVRVNLHGPSGVIITTNALLDDGASVTLISADLANSVHIQGQPETLSIRGAWNSNIVCKSERVNFKLSNINGETFDVRARKINELDLPTQDLSKVNLNDYEHLRPLKCVLTCEKVKPKILIGQDNFHLIMSLRTVYRGKYEPCATLTKLGWCLNGIVPTLAYARGRTLTTEHALNTTMYQRATPIAAAAVTHASHAPSIATPADAYSAQRETHTCADAHLYSSQQQALSEISSNNEESKQLHELVHRSLALESIGVNSKQRVNKDDIRAVNCIDNSARLINGNYEVGLPWKNDLKLQRKPTKRELLRIYMSIFDIFGFLAPFTVRAKIMLQNIWKTSTQWDNEIPSSKFEVFRTWITELQTLSSLRIPRWYFTSARGGSERDYDTDAHCSASSQSETTIEMHVFCDAAPTAVCAVAYWRKITTNNEVCVSFIASKCRSTPVKKYITIPKLELQSAVIACRLADTIARETRLTTFKRYFWTDSLIVLHQIKNDTRNYQVFVANRLGEIDELSQSHEWNYISTSMNIADKATKINTYQLSDDCEWLRGPEFLYAPREDWPKYDPEKQKINNDQLLQVNTIQTENKEGLPIVPDPTKFSSWIRLWRCMANVLLFIEKCKKSADTRLDTQIMQRAETQLLRYSQQKAFSEEIYLLKNNMEIKNHSRLRKLTPFLDESGILRVGGRIDAAPGVESSLKHPVILDGHDRITKLIIKRYHETAAHGHNETVVNDIRQKYWVINLRPTARTVASQHNDFSAELEKDDLEYLPDL